ncbi:hypothetical protein J2851_003087 [Azospirillum rugosum]|uniref:Uncharacterized protein n=1 Tax=Azospirillum rugosum TaxID=416170 RepID=A0ABS4SL77_9PROT|nr:hypothetical protein [Azospirillum rugosum]
MPERLARTVRAGRSGADEAEWSRKTQASH